MLAEGPQELGRLLTQLEVGYQIGAPGVAGQLFLNPILEQLFFMILQDVWNLTILFSHSSTNTSYGFVPYVRSSTMSSNCSLITLQNQKCTAAANRHPPKPPTRPRRSPIPRHRT